MTKPITLSRLTSLLRSAAAVPKSLPWSRAWLHGSSWVALGLGLIALPPIIDVMSSHSEFLRESLFTSFIHFAVFIALIFLAASVAIRGTFTLLRRATEALGNLLRRWALDETSIRALLSSSMLFLLVAAVLIGNRLDTSFSYAGQRADAAERLAPLWEPIRRRVERLLPAGFVHPTSPEAPNLAAMLRCNFVRAAYYVDDNDILHLLDRDGPETVVRLADWAPHHQRLLTRRQAAELSRAGLYKWPKPSAAQLRNSLIDLICFGSGSGAPAVEYRPGAITLIPPGTSGQIFELDAGKRRLGLWLVDDIRDPEGIGAMLESRGLRGTVSLSAGRQLVYEGWLDEFTFLAPNFAGRVPLAIRLYPEMPIWPFVGLLLCLLAIAGTAWELIRQLSLLWKAHGIALAQSNFVSSITHEMRTPVATIKLYTELLQAGVNEPGVEQADMLSTIVQECDRLTTTIDNVLGFSRLRQGKWAYRFAAVSSRSLVFDAVQTIRPLLQSRGMTYTISCLQDVTLEADQAAIHQVLINLLTNAVKYAADGKELVVSVLPAGRDHVAFEVLDFGPGIPAAEHQRIFQPFYRVGDELTRTQSGSGLGLALVQEHVKAHHGTITLNSTPEQGTTFRICLPIKQPVTARSVRSAET